MSLQQELSLKTSITPLAREAMLSVYYTASSIKKRADEFFRSLDLSDVQFNVLMLLAHQADPQGGLSQAQVSDMMLVNRANITTLIDRMEKADLVVRTAAPADRRYNIIKLTPYGQELLAQVEPLYMKEIEKAIALTQTEQRQLIKMLEKIRHNLTRQGLGTK